MYLSSILQNYNLSKADFETHKQNLSSFSDDELKEMLKELNPALHNTTDLNDRERIIKAIAIAKVHGHFEPESSGEKSVTTKR